MSQLENETRNALADFVERIEKLIEGKKKATAAIKAEYEQAAAMGFDKKALQQLIKERESDGDATIKHRQLVRTYREALGGMVGTPLGDWAREWSDRNEAYAEMQNAPKPMDDFLSKRQSRPSRSAGEGESDPP